MSDIYRVWSQNGKECMSRPGLDGKVLSNNNNKHKNNNQMHDLCSRSSTHEEL
jgi:hypothetical protein